MSDTVKAIMVGLGAAILVGGFVFFITSMAEDTNKRVQFEGACLYLKGEVKDDICVTDGEVVLTRDDFTENYLED